MALIKCPECGEKISDSSDRCIHCGYILEKEATQLIEQTSKKLKAEELTAVIILIAGILMMFVSNDVVKVLGTLMIFGGIVALLIIKIKIWWRHK